MKVAQTEIRLLTLQAKDIGGYNDFLIPILTVYLIYIVICHCTIFVIAINGNNVNFDDEDKFN